MVFYFLLASLLSTLQLAVYANPIAAAATECALGFQRLGFEEFDFARYDEFFNANSTMILAEAGVYTGAENIEEYVRFAHPSSPYIDTFTGVTSAIHPVGYDPIARTRTFVGTAVYTYGMSPKYSIPINVTLSSGGKFIYNQDLNKLESVYIYYTSAWLDLYFGNLVNTDAVKHFICSTIEQNCKGTHMRNGATSIPGCVKKLNALPIFSNARVDGFDFPCRALHAVFATLNSAHCAHISFFEEKDLSGDVKCQTVENIQVSDLFSDSDLMLHRTETAKAGLDPDIGYRIECVDSPVWKSPLGDGTGGCSWVADRPEERCAVYQASIACRKTCSSLCA